MLLLSSRRLLGLGGIIGPAAFVTAWAVLGARKVGYNPITDHISRLAAAGVPERAAMSAGFVAFGLAVPAYGWALRRSLPGPAWTTAVATGLATLGVAAFPLDGPVGDTPHAIAASLGYATLAATPLLAARPLHRSGRNSWAAASVVAGVASGICLAATVAGPATGLLQRTGLGIGDLWLAATGAAIASGRFAVQRVSQGDA